MMFFPLKNSQSRPQTICTPKVLNRQKFIPKNVFSLMQNLGRLYSVLSPLQSAPFFFDGLKITYLEFSASSRAVLVQITPVLGVLVGVVVTLILIAICIVIFVKIKNKVRWFLALFRALLRDVNRAFCCFLSSVA